MHYSYCVAIVSLPVRRGVASSRRVVKMTTIKMVCLYFGVLLALSASAVRAHMNLYLNQFEVMRLLGEWILLLVCVWGVVEPAKCLRVWRLGGCYDCAVL